MSRKFSVLFAAMFLVVALAAGAWAYDIPSFSGKQNQQDDTNTDAVIDAVIAETATSWDKTGTLLYDYLGRGYQQANVRGSSPDIKVSRDLLFDIIATTLSKDAPGNNYPGGPRWTFDPTVQGAAGVPAATSSGDILLLYTGRKAEKAHFLADAFGTPAAYSLDIASTKKMFSTVRLGTKNLLSADVEYRFGSKPCVAGECAFNHDVLTIASVDGADDSFMNKADSHVYTYVPCGKFDKDFQIFQNEMAVHPWDMVRLGKDFDHVFTPNLGFYVVERDYNANDGWEQAEALVERVQNSNGKVAEVINPHFDFVPLGERYPGVMGFRTVSADPSSNYGKNLFLSTLRCISSDVVVSSDVAYLQTEDWAITRKPYEWFSWVNTRNSVAYDVTFGASTWSINPVMASLAPGFARYYAVSADFTNADPSDFISMCFRGGGDLCQYVTMDPEVVSLDCICGTWTATDGGFAPGPGVNPGFCNLNANCWATWPLSADSRFVANLNKALSMDETPSYVVDANLCAASSCEGNFHFDFVTGSWKPSSGTPCQAVSFDAYLKDATCNQDARDVLLLKFRAQVRQERVCSDAVIADVTAALKALATPDKPYNVGPADAFLNNASVDASLGNNLQVVFKDNAGKEYDMAKVAMKADWIANASSDIVGVKNFFDVWADQNETSHNPMTVKEAWDDNKLNNLVNISFYIAIVNADAPAGKDTLTAGKGYFIYYAGKDKNYEAKFATATGFKGGDAPTPPPAPKLALSAAGGTEAAEDCMEIAKASFSEAAWKVIVGDRKEADYTFTFAPQVCKALSVEGLAASADVDVTAKYDDANGTLFIMNYAGENPVLDLLPLPAEATVATAKEDTFKLTNGGDYDKDQEGKAVLDAHFAFVKVTATKKADPTHGGDSGGGGCSLGFAPLALVLLAPLALLKK